MMEKTTIIVKTHKNLERIAASYVRDLIPDSEVLVKPNGYAGIILLKIKSVDTQTLKATLMTIPEIEKILFVQKCVEANLDRICEAVRHLARESLKENEKFAVHTVRRGNHPFTSIDVNIKAGACIQQETQCKVDLTLPDKIFWIEIIDNKAYISIVSRDIFYRKKTPDKPDSMRYLKKTIIVQMPYLDEIASSKIGVRIGRIVQSYEIPSIIVAPIYRVNATELMYFLQGLHEGIMSRYKLQLKTYNDRKVSKTKVYLYDLYQLVRNINRDKEGIIITTTKGQPIKEETITKVKSLYTDKKKVYVFIGSREGIPTGLFKFADILLDVAPQVTLATDVAVSSIISAILNMLLL